MEACLNCRGSTIGREGSKMDNCEWADRHNLVWRWITKTDSLLPRHELKLANAETPTLQAEYTYNPPVAILTTPSITSAISSSSSSSPEPPFPTLIMATCPLAACLHCFLVFPQHFWQRSLSQHLLQCHTILPFFMSFQHPLQPIDERLRCGRSLPAARMTWVAVGGRWQVGQK